MKNLEHGFTLVELLVTVAIILTLSGAGIVGVQSAREKARTLVEINAGRNLITGYLGHAAENNGQVLAGYREDRSVTNIEGKTLHFPLNARYPWRLAPSVPKIEGVLLFNGTETALKHPDRDYLVSVHPNFGVNSTLVGGHFGTGSPLEPSERLIAAYGKFYLSQLTDCEDPGKLIVFASARSSANQPGYFEIRPPNLVGRIWSSKAFSQKTPAVDHGYVDFRWGGKAVAIMLGGNVELKTEDDLRDMRRWSIQAARTNNPEFTISQNPQ